MSPAEFVSLLERDGFNFFTGVPCSLVKGVIAELESRGRWLPETREDAAMGLAAGAYLGGCRPVVIMQNSGLGVSVNALTSLHLIYRLPCLLIVTWRGYRGEDAPEHIIMGRICEPLFELIGVPHRAPELQQLADDLRWASSALETERRPVALLVRKGVLS